jgi:hypothetical protein
LLLAVLFTFYRPIHWRDLLAHVAFMAGIAVMFSFVGNRGLIRNSIHYARYVAPTIPPGLKLEFDLTSSGPSQAQLFWDSGGGFDEAASARQNHEPHQGQQTLRFPLPDKPLRSLRFDPRDNAGEVAIRGIRLIDAGQRTRAVLPLDSLQAQRDIARMETKPDALRIGTVPDSKDAITLFTPEAMARINQALERPAGP